MALIGLILATIVNIFWANETLYWVTTYAGVLIFAALTAYDMQKITQLSKAGLEGEAESRASIIGALSLYLDFINLFLFLLRIFGRVRLAGARGGGMGSRARPRRPKLRCWWCLGSEEMREYHDSEWGRPLHGEVELFERLTLEAFQSGLSWRTILNKRENFRKAFDGFDPDRVAAYGPTRSSG